MKAITRFKVKDLMLSGEWDEDNKLLLITELGGELGIKGKFMGLEVDARGAVTAGLDNRARVKIYSIGKLPGFLIPGILNLLKKFGGRFARAAEVEKDVILINPNKLILGTSELNVLIQPATLEFSETVVGSLRERILDWVEQNAGSIAKETLDILMSIPDVLQLLLNLTKDARIPWELKLKIGLCITYVISPVKLIPEIIAGPLGFVDDAVAMMLLISSLITEIPPEVIRENWQGRPDVLEIILKGYDLMVMAGNIPEGLLQKLVALFGPRPVKKETAAGIV